MSRDVVLTKEMHFMHYIIDNPLYLLESPGLLGPTPHSLIYLAVIIKHYYHTKLELTGCLGSKERAGPLYSLKGPWGPHPLTKLACT